MKKKVIGIISIIVIGLSVGLIDEIKAIFFEEEIILTPPYEVVRVVDGDTIIIDMDGVKERVRFIGLDAPESVHPDPNKNTEEGRLSAEYTKKALEGKMVSLEFDVQERDQYGRILAYVYIDAKMFNKILIEEGYAKAISYPPNVKYQKEFRKLDGGRAN